jgi:transcriptional regulator
MYLPKQFSEPSLPRLHGLIDAYGFGALIVGREDGSLEIAHVPFCVDRTRGPRGTLFGHVARANPIWRLFEGRTEVTVVFVGPHGYVSPAFYTSRTEHVPTWNYAVVHALGVPRLLPEKEDAMGVLARLVTQNESPRADPWRMDELEPAKRDELLQHIVVFEIEITRLEGKFKLSQNREQPDRRGALRGITERGDPLDGALAELMRHYIE